MSSLRRIVATSFSRLGLCQGTAYVTVLFRLNRTSMSGRRPLGKSAISAFALLFSENTRLSPRALDELVGPGGLAREMHRRYDSFINRRAEVVLRLASRIPSDLVAVQNP